MTTHNMVYNSQKEFLKISEYGRNVQNLIDYIKTIEDQEKRQQYTEAIINLMHQMNPIHKNNLDYKEKLWRHLFRISDYEINVVPPSGVIPSPESSHFKPGIIDYPENQRNFRHYGQLVKDLIKKAIEMEDEEKKKQFLLVIATYMKMAYRTWNKDQYGNDDVVKSDILSMSNGKLSLPDDCIIEVPPIPSYNRRSKRTGGRDNQRSSRSNRNYRRRR